jgi:EAL domain-containing protein (putative c-di-GMP-specific phosphodiesterase class I)
MSKYIHKQLLLNNELRKAIELNEFELYFQPIVEMRSENITSCEALIRWNHPQKGLIFPDYFIPFAEESDLIIQLGDWVINEACKKYKNFDSSLLDISVNISSKQFIQEDFVQKILEATKLHDISPSAIKLELTESVAVNNLPDTIKKMNILKSHGFKIAMDDFGTGYSSLSYLKNLPFDFIKIDRSFVKDMLENEDDASLIKTILTISKQLKFKVIAEGVETHEHISVLKALECDFYQGYVKSKPVPEEEFKKLLAVRGE